MKTIIIKFYRNNKKIRKIKYFGVISFSYIDNILILNIYGERLPIKIYINKNEILKVKVI